MGTIGRPLTRRLLAAYIAVILVIMYIPILVVGLASISKSRFFLFPMRRTSAKWYEMTWDSLQVHESFLTSLTVAVCVALISVILAFFGALAYARYDWRGRKLFQQVLLIPVFFPQAVLGLALQLWFNSMGIQMSWQSTVFAPARLDRADRHAGGRDPGIWLRFGGGGGGLRPRRLALANIPDHHAASAGAGIFAGFLFAVLLSWGNFPLAYFTSGADVTVPEWLYGKMIGGYTPMVPAVGLITVVLGGVILAVGLTINGMLQRRD